MHTQRVNVAMSRAKNRLVLVRSLSSRSQIPNSTDFKCAVMDFFEKYGKNLKPEPSFSTQDIYTCKDIYGLIENFVQFLRKHVLESYVIREMGNVWPNSALIEDPRSA